jgi:hypothetical protein
VGWLSKLFKPKARQKYLLIVLTERATEESTGVFHRTLELAFERLKQRGWTPGNILENKAGYKSFTFEAELVPGGRLKLYREEGGQPGGAFPGPSPGFVSLRLIDLPEASPEVIDAIYQEITSALQMEIRGLSSHVSTN